jgi:hypothetical protein
VYVYVQGGPGVQNGVAAHLLGAGIATLSQAWRHGHLMPGHFWYVCQYIGVLWRGLALPSVRHGLKVQRQRQ